MDFLRGAAMLLVVLGHTITGSAINSQDSILFDIVWSLQMPLFILISGYVTRYGSAPTDAAGLFKLLGRRTLAYLLPWFVFTILFNGLILQKQPFTLDELFWHMDKGYWFLITIWTISMIFGISRFAASKICRREEFIPAATLCFYVIGMAVLGGIGYLMGLSFLCIKLTLYYMPFFFIGCLFGVYRERINSRLPQLFSIAVAVCTVLWIVSVVKINLFELSDTKITDILLRAGTSLCGCIAVCGLLRAVKETTLVYRGINWFGRHTIEVFMVHYYFLNLIRFADKPDFFTPRGMALAAANYIITVLIVSVVIKLIGSNRWLNLILFGKLPKKS